MNDERWRDANHPAFSAFNDNNKHDNCPHDETKSAVLRRRPKCTMPNGRTSPAWHLLFAKFCFFNVGFNKWNTAGFPLADDPKEEDLHDK